MSKWYRCFEVEGDYRETRELSEPSNLANQNLGLNRTQLDPNKSSCRLRSTRQTKTFHQTEFANPPTRSFINIVLKYRIIIYKKNIHM